MGRRPIPRAHQREIIDLPQPGHRHRGLLRARFLQDDWDSIAATIDYSIDWDRPSRSSRCSPVSRARRCGSSSSRCYEPDWERFDGFTPTFNHPTLTARELQFLLGAAYSRFYLRPSYLANFLRIRTAAHPPGSGAHGSAVSGLTRRLSQGVAALTSRPVAC